MKVISSLWGDRVVIDEVEVHVSPRGDGRGAIARRGDGLYCIYLHGKFSRGVGGLKFDDDYADQWQKDRTPPELIYQDHEPEQGIYGTLDEARREVRYRLGIEEAELP